MAQSYKVTRKELDDWLPRGLDHSHEKWFDPDVHRPVQEIYKGLGFRCEDYKRALNSQNPDQPTITFYHRAVEALWSDVDAGSVLQDEWPNGPKLSMVGAEEGAPSQRATVSSPRGCFLSEL
jgi:hypothetical protein